METDLKAKHTRELRNTAIIKGTYEGKNSEENGKNLSAALAPEATWTEAAGFPYAGTYRGFDEIFKNVFFRLGTEWEGYKIVIDGYLADGDKVVAFGTYSGTYKLTGKYFQARVAHIYVFNTEGKILSFEQFVDSKTVTDVMRPNS